MSSGRAGKQIAFAGRNRRKQRFAQISFPGEAVQEWDLGTGGQEAKAEDHKLANACVFFPDASSDFFGIHTKRCTCAKLYKGVDPAFATWTNGQAPFGCKWFDKWKSNLNDVEDFDQVAVVVYKRGRLGDDVNGLGNSQKGELKEATSRGLCIVKVDVDELVRIIEPLSNTPESFAHMTRDEVQRHLDDLLTKDRTLRGDAQAKSARCLDKLKEAEAMQVEAALIVNGADAEAARLVREAKVEAARVLQEATGKAARVVQGAQAIVRDLLEKQEQLLAESSALVEEVRAASLQTGQTANPHVVCSTCKGSGASDDPSVLSVSGAGSVLVNGVYDLQKDGCYSHRQSGDVCITKPAGKAGQFAISARRVIRYTTQGKQLPLDGWQAERACFQPPPKLQFVGCKDCKGDGLGSRLRQGTAACGATAKLLERLEGIAAQIAAGSSGGGSLGSS